MNSRQTHDPNCKGWTPTLQRTAELVASAYTNKGMGDIEVISEHAAKKRVDRVREHLEIEYRVELPTRGELVRFCREIRSA